MRISDWSSDVCSSDLDTRTPWAHAVLAEQGYAYSSSVAPVVHDHYGWPQSPRHAWRPVAGSDLVEWPVKTARFAGPPLAAGGGGFLRLPPYGLTAERHVGNGCVRPC